MTDTNGGITVTQAIILLTNSQHVSDQIGYHQVILEEYINGDGIHINYDGTTEVFKIKIGSDLG